MNLKYKSSIERVGDEKKNNENFVTKVREENFLEDEESNYKIISDKIESKLDYFKSLEKISITEVDKIIKKIIDGYFLKLSSKEQLTLINDKEFISRFDNLEKKVDGTISVEFPLGYSSRLRDVFLKEIGLRAKNKLVRFISWTKTEYFSMYEKPWYDEEYDFIGCIEEELVIPENITKNDLYNKVSGDHFHIKKEGGKTFLKIISEESESDIKSVQMVSLEEIVLGLPNSKDYLEVLDILKYIYSTPEVLIYIDNNLGMHLSSLKIKDQISFLKFLINNDIPNLDSRIQSILIQNPDKYKDVITEWSDENGNWRKILKDFSGIIWEGKKKDGVLSETWYVEPHRSDINEQSFFKSFLSTSGDLEFGENILKIGENFEPEVANLIFEKYSELVDKVDEAENELRNEFGQEADISEAVKNISEKLLSEGKVLLKEWSEKKDEVSLEEARESLEKIDANLKLQLNVYKYLSGCGVDCLKESLNVNLVKIDALKLSQDREKVKEMEEIYRSNYSEYDEFQDLLIKKFREKFAENKEVEFYILENKKDSENEIAGFIAFEKKDDETLEMSSVNLSQEYQGYKMGEDMILGPIQELNKKYTITAQAIVDSNALKKYLEIGFIQGKKTRINIDEKEFEIVDIRLEKVE